MHINDINEIHEKALYYVNTILRPIVKSTGEPIEGNIFEEDPNEKDIFLPKRKNVIVSCQNKTKALEIGFNSGFSAVLILLSNRDIKLTCVDIGWHSYVIPCYEQIKKDFGDRIELLVGDSRIVVPTINDSFDLVHIDGGHSEDIAESDILHTNKLLMKNAVIIMDDVNMNDDNHVLAKLWKKYIQLYNYKEVSFEIFKNDHNDVREITE